MTVRPNVYLFYVITNLTCTQVYDILRRKENKLTVTTDGIAENNLELAETGSMMNVSDGGRRAVVEFTATRCAILEREQHVRVGIRRFGRLDCTVVCK